MSKNVVRTATACAFLLLAPQLAAAATAEVDLDSTPATLTLSGDATGETVAITCPAGNLLINGADPSSGPLPCAAIGLIHLELGDGNDIADLSAVQGPAFLATLETRVDGGNGDDVINGSAFADTLMGGTGNDSLHGGPGNDDLDGGEGNDILHGNGEDDVLRVGANGGRDHTDGDSGTDQLIVVGTAGADHFVVFDDPTTPDPEHNHMDIRGGVMTLRVGLVESISIDLGEGDDRLEASLYSTASLRLRGGDGSDTLVFGGPCAAGTLTDDRYTQPSHADATFDGFESSSVSSELVFATIRLDVGGGESTVPLTLSVGASCHWTASTSDESWLTFPDGSSGTGPGTVNLEVADNPATAPRSGTVAIAGVIVDIRQAAGDGMLPSSEADAAPEPTSDEPPPPAEQDGSNNGSRFGCSVFTPENDGLLMLALASLVLARWLRRQRR